MNNGVIEQLHALNDLYLPRYLGTSHEEDPILPPTCPIKSSSKEIPKYDVEYFDIACANALLYHHTQINYLMSPNMIEFISRLSYEGFRRLEVFSCDYATKEFCNALALHRLPPNMSLYNFLLWIERYESNIFPIWFPYAMLSFVLTQTKCCSHRPYRSRYLIGVINQFGTTKTVGANHLHQLRYDTFGMVEKTKRLLRVINKDQRVQGIEYVEYMVDSLRQLSILYLAHLLKLECTWNALRLIGREVLGQTNIMHQKVVDKHYKEHALTGV